MGHRVVTRVREILPADLPTITDLRATRTATPQDLLNMGLVPTGELNLYVSREQERKDGGSESFKPLRELPGEVLSEGTSRRDVYAKLSPNVKDAVLRSRVRRKVDGKDVRLTVPMRAVEVTDVVEEDGLFPVAFLGER